MTSDLEIFETHALQCRVFTWAIFAVNVSSKFYHWVWARYNYIDLLLDKSVPSSCGAILPQNETGLKLRHGGLLYNFQRLIY